MTLAEIQERLMSLSTLPPNWDHQQADPPTKHSIETIWKFAKIAVGSYQFNPTDCAPSKDGGIALVWLHPINRDRYADLEANNDGNIMACLSSRQKEIMDTWQVSGYGVPVIGEAQRSIEESFQRIREFLKNGSLLS